MRLLAIAGCLMALCMVFFVALARRLNQPPFDLARLVDLWTGMTPEQVQDVLGSLPAPRSVPGRTQVVVLAHRLRHLR